MSTVPKSINTNNCAIFSKKRKKRMKIIVTKYRKVNSCLLQSCGAAEEKKIIGTGLLQKVAKNKFLENSVFCQFTHGGPQWRLAAALRVTYFLWSTFIIL